MPYESHLESGSAMTLLRTKRARMMDTHLTHLKAMVTGDGPSNVKHLRAKLPLGIMKTL